MSDAGTPRTETLHAQCCVVGGGPAGMMLGLLLARAGVDTVVLEKHGDFLRDFRGDTVHPSTLEVMHELGVLEEFLKRPHQKAHELRVHIGETEVSVADFSHLSTRCGYIAFIPQWDFLDFLANHAARYPTFRLLMETEVTELLKENGRITGVRGRTTSGAMEVRAGLTIGADGRRSTVRERAGLVIDELGAPMDVLWLRLSRKSTDPEQAMGRFDRGHILVMLDRGEYWQCGFVIAKGGYAQIRERGLDAFREEVGAIAPFVADRVGELKDWDDIKLLTVAVDRLRRWHTPGLLCIGDAAHAMSPVAGVGINLAIQDAVATANLLAAPLRAGTVTSGDLEKLERRRRLPTRLTQRMQIIVQNRVIRSVIGSREKLSVPWPVRLLQRWPLLRRIPARLIGVGFRPEHVATQERKPQSTR